MNDQLLNFINGFLGTNAIEIIASISGFLCLYLLIKRNIWCWFFGFIQVSLFSWVFFNAKLYSDTGLHVIYMGLQVYGWWQWTTHQSHNEQLLVEWGTRQQMFKWAIVSLVSAAALGTIMHTYTDASFAYLDAFTTATSLVAQWLLTRRLVFNWLFWIVVDIVAIYVYLQKGLYPTAVLYATFLVLCALGFKEWRQAYQQQQQLQVSEN